MKKILFIYNPYSGENHILVYLDYIIEVYQNRGYIIHPFRFTRESDIQSLIQLMKEEYSHILVSGGDGTVNLVVNHILNNGIKTPIAVLPSGTANDFANMLGTKGGVKEACEKILNGTVDWIDVGKVNDRYFVNVLSAGLFTEVSQRTPTILKNTFGKLAYYMSTIQELPRFKKMKLSVKSDETNFNGDTLIYFVFNGKTAGNINIAINSNEKDGLLDVVIIKGGNPIKALNIFIKFLLLGNIVDYPSGIVHFQTNKLEIESSALVNVDIDGEQGPATPLNIECLHKVLAVIR